LAEVQQPLYELRNATRRYGDDGTQVFAVDSIDLRIDRGEFLAVVGPSGSGKTTLLQLLGALDRPTAGEVLLEGRHLSSMSDAELATLRRETLGFIFQQFNLIPTLTARQNVEAALAPADLPAGARHRRAVEMLDRVGLGERSDHLPSQLSGGEQQRVAIARALSNEPEVLLADEPTGNLDSATGEDIVDVLRQLWEGTGLSIVLVTHNEGITGSAQRTVRMQDGRLAEGDRESER
jgi:putative ABC transport system ATP-binding protein